LALPTELVLSGMVAGAGVLSVPSELTMIRALPVFAQILSVAI
jgi:hypothetical protein